MKQLKNHICSLFVILGFNQYLMADNKFDTIINTTSHIPEVFSGFKCTEFAFGNSFKTLEHKVENGNQILTLSDWNINEIVSSEKYLITKVEMQGGMLMKITGVEMTLQMGTQVKSIDLNMSTTQLLNHSLLIQPSEAQLNCQF